MNDVCEKCGSVRLKYVRGYKATHTSPEEPEHWECEECGHCQPVEKDYEYYEDDFT